VAARYFPSTLMCIKFQVGTTLQCESGSALKAALLLLCGANSMPCSLLLLLLLDHPPRKLGGSYFFTSFAPRVTQLYQRLCLLPPSDSAALVSCHLLLLSRMKYSTLMPAAVTQARCFAAPQC
jgi:hypothetical protein